MSGARGRQVALSADPWAIPPEELADVEAVLTIVGGRITYRAE